MYLTSEPTDDNFAATNSCSFSGKGRNRRDNFMVFNDQGKEYDDFKLTNLESITVNGNAVSDNELSYGNCIDDELDENNIVRHIQTLKQYLKVSVGEI